MVNKTIHTLFIKVLHYAYQQHQRQPVMLLLLSEHQCKIQNYYNPSFSISCFYFHSIQSVPKNHSRFVVSHGCKENNILDSKILSTSQIFMHYCLLRNYCRNWKENVTRDFTFSSPNNYNKCHLILFFILFVLWGVFVMLQLYMPFEPNFIAISYKLLLIFISIWQIRFQKETFSVLNVLSDISISFHFFHRFLARNLKFIP